MLKSGKDLEYEVYFVKFKLKRVARKMKAFNLGIQYYPLDINVQVTELIQ